MTLEQEKKILNEVEERMKKAIEVMEREFSKIMATRITPEILDPVKVEAYGTLMPIKQVATIVSPKPRVLVVEPWDKSLVKEIERAILKANLGVTPQSDGEAITLPFPKLTEEERQKFVLQVKRLAEEFREEIRAIRREEIEKIKTMEKNKEISEDDKFRMQERIQKLTEKYIDIIDERLERKEKEILEV
uniref:Ribosome-recycling factor n=1 Tax=Caldisericum exile TaxID=693075 RepID=A0A7C4U142_9BACT